MIHRQITVVSTNRSRTISFRITWIYVGFRRFFGSFLRRKPLRARAYAFCIISFVTRIHMYWFDILLRWWHRYEIVVECWHTFCFGGNVITCALTTFIQPYFRKFVYPGIRSVPPLRSFRLFYFSSRISCFRSCSVMIPVISVSSSGRPVLPTVVFCLLFDSDTEFRISIDIWCRNFDVLICCIICCWLETNK